MLVVPGACLAPAEAALLVDAGGFGRDDGVRWLILSLLVEFRVSLE